MANNLKTLIGKLNATCRRAAERAAGMTQARGHYEVDLEHLFLALLEMPASDVALAARAGKVDVDALTRDLEAEIGRFEVGNTRTPVFSSRIPTLFEHAWLIASLDSHTAQIRSGHLLIALLTERDLAQFATRGSVEFSRFPIDTLKHDLDSVTQGSEEAVPAGDEDTAEAASDNAADEAAADGASRTPSLDRYTTNLTQAARDGRIDPVIGRDGEIRQVMDILLRRRQNNPILTGEAGVGKTAVVEGLARRIVEGDVPPALADVALRVLDLGLLQAGASVKGEFENRLKGVIDEVRKSPTPIILFIDEAHTIIGAGGQAGQGDAANLLKPALARGELRTIAATTWSEYKKYFEKDAALARRFQVVKVEEPDEELTAAMLRGMTALMETHFNVRILDEAITEAARLSNRYITGRQLPDKAVSVLDTACARVALAQSATPAKIDDDRKRLARLDAEITALTRERAAGGNHDERLETLQSQRDSIAAECTADEQRWERERALVGEIQQLRAALENGTDPNADVSAEGALSDDERRDKLKSRAGELATLQGETPLVANEVDAHAVAEIVAAWTGVPLGKMVADEIHTVLDLKNRLENRVIGQSHALEAIAQRVRTARAGLEDPDKPKGVFLFVGPSGVGKTETALALADVLYGGERKLVTINMSEYQEAHTVSGLKGSPPGYVGYGEGGVLTEAVRRNPYSVILLDEVEKAHPDVMELFYQVFDKGTIDDAEGRPIDFRNTLIILTSNVGSATITKSCLNKAADEMPALDEMTDAIKPELYQVFQPALLGRLKVVPYYAISDDALAEIIKLKLARIAARVADNHQARMTWSDALVEAVLARCTEVDSGARNVDNILTGTLLPEIAGTVLSRMAEGQGIERIKVGARKSGEFTYKIN
ncbi:type VI secretion system ATPase TssH [Salinisphaera sp. Q1T1-3]|uniref:type VI secretion system ATPase TssH n=1 Tax=Salinisphaera sp. Q1T1-3 TaxID=2321229 RepID=UPI000E73940A|nr:type VI secretion system ATPase TssH [Salinisphaera sp. Q1T1-3]RJS91693.1 type VI secretion system ATPase TssH [Salinisphaera sp. Q1T1-3]